MKDGPVYIRRGVLANSSHSWSSKMVSAVFFVFALAPVALCSPSSHIVGGNDVDIEDYKWQVSIFSSLVVVFCMVCTRQGHSERQGERQGERDGARERERERSRKWICENKWQQTRFFRKENIFFLLEIHSKDDFMVWNVLSLSS